MSTECASCSGSCGMDSDLRSEGSLGPGPTSFVLPWPSMELWEIQELCIWTRQSTLLWRFVCQYRGMEHILFNSLLVWFLTFRHVACGLPFVLMPWAAQTLGASLCFTVASFKKIYIYSLNKALIISSSAWKLLMMTAPACWEVSGSGCSLFCVRWNWQSSGTCLSSEKGSGQYEVSKGAAYCSELTEGA